MDANDKRVRSESDDLSRWWTVLNDPVLNSLVEDAYRQNLTLRDAALRVLQARAQLGYAVGSFFPQSQTLSGDSLREAISRQKRQPQLRAATLLQSTRYQLRADLGTRLLGAFPPRHRNGEREPERLGRELRRRARDPVGRRGVGLRHDSHHRKADRVHDSKRPIAAGDLGAGRCAFPGRQHLGSRR